MCIFVQIPISMPDLALQQNGEIKFISELNRASNQTFARNGCREVDNGRLNGQLAANNPQMAKVAISWAWQRNCAGSSTKLSLHFTIFCVFCPLFSREHQHRGPRRARQLLLSQHPPIYCVCWHLYTFTCLYFYFLSIADSTIWVLEHFRAVYTKTLIIIIYLLNKSFTWYRAIHEKNEGLQKS